jgi:hypothetical protein
MSSSGQERPDSVIASDTPGMEVPGDEVALHPGRLDVTAIYMLEAFVGIWLFLSPWILDAYRHTGALLNGMILGGVVIVGSIASAAAVSATTEVIVDGHHWWGRVTIVIGVWLVICSPVVDLDSLHSTILSNVLVGVALIVLGALATRASTVQIDQAAGDPTVV